MQGIPEQDESADAVRRRIASCRRGKMCGDAAAHRLAADEHRVPTERTMAPRGGNGGAIAGLELLGSIGNPTALLGVEEVEREHIDAPGGEPVGKLSDEATVLAGAGPVRQHERRLHSVLASRSIGERAGAPVFADVDIQSICHRPFAKAMSLRTYHESAGYRKFNWLSRVPQCLGVPSRKRV